MSEHGLHIKNLKTVFAILLLTFLCITVIFALMIKKNQQENLDNTRKISALIDEVGELKQMNDNLNSAYADGKKDLLNLQATLRDINETVKDKMAGSETAIMKISDANRRLLDEIASKELSIASLAQKNNALKEEVQAISYAPEIVDIAVIGQNSGLTDSIMMLSINPATGKISVFSLPRDLYHKGRKINEIYNSYGIEKLKETIGEITGIMADKYIIFDFSSFVAVIDRFGGIDLDVKKGFTDNQYPGPNFSYTTISFAAGQQHMDGSTALKYVRSRKSTSDFDRSARQQEVLRSLRQKLADFDIFGNFDTVAGIYGDVKDSVKTDLNLFEMLALYSNSKDFDIRTDNVVSNRNFLYTSVSKTGQYILLPVNGSYTNLKKHISDIVNS